MTKCVLIVPQISQNLFGQLFGIFLKKLSSDVHCPCLHCWPPQSRKEALTYAQWTMFGIFILEIVMITAAAMNFNQKTASAGILQVLPIMAALIGIDIWSRSHYFKLTAFLRDIQSFSDSVGNLFLCSILFKSLLEAFMELVMNWKK